MGDADVAAESLASASFTLTETWDTRLLNLNGENVGAASLHQCNGSAAFRAIKPAEAGLVPENSELVRHEDAAIRPRCR